MTENIDFSETVSLEIEDEEKKKEYSISIDRFDDKFLSERFQKVANHLKLSKPTPVQSYVWKPLLKGENVVTKSKTGSGKTLGFLLPIFEKVLTYKKSIQRTEESIAQPYALILTPTRELASQIYSLSMKLYNIYNIETKIVIGGVNKETMNDQLRNSLCDVLIATPGRLIDLIGEKSVSLQLIQIITFDEADKMLDMGFQPQLTQIHDLIYTQEKQLQVLFFSATYQENIKQLVKEWCSPEDLLLLSISPPTLLSSVHSELSICTNIVQDIHVCAEHKKPRKLMDFLRFVLEKDKESGARQRSLICIFVNTIKSANRVHHFIQEKWNRSTSPRPQDQESSEKKPKTLRVDLLHSQLSQQLRKKILGNFRCGAIQVLVTTDVFGRGMDIPHLNYILNYDFPSNLTTYIHRIGRTGRSGQKGYSRSFLTPPFYPLTPDLELLLKASNQTIPPLLHTVAESQRILREYNTWEEQHDIEKKTKEEHKENEKIQDTISLKEKKKNETISIKRTDNEERIIKPKKMPLVPSKRRKN